MKESTAKTSAQTVDEQHDRMVQAATEILSGKSKKGLFARLLPFLGPAFIASVAYVDPGNFATNISGGARFGYLLLWVIIVSNLMAMLTCVGILFSIARHAQARERMPGSASRSDELPSAQPT